jgi:hypothetical protein
MNLDEPELPMVRLAACGCVIAASTPPVGYVFKPSGTGDVRWPVYACDEHDRTRARAQTRTKAKRAAKKGSATE